MLSYLNCEITERSGFSDISAIDYLFGIVKFKEFIRKLEFTILERKLVAPVSNDLVGKTYVFTGARSKEAEAAIISKGGKIGSGVSKTTTHLVVKSVGSGSAKEKKAIDLGCTIITLIDLEKELL